MEQAKLERKPAGVAARREVPIVVRLKGASEVAVTGDFTQWSKDGIRLRKGPNDEWRTILELDPGEYQYRLVVDGNWQDDPQAARHVPNPFGGQNAILKVPASRA